MKKPVNNFLIFMAVTVFAITLNSCEKSKGKNSELPNFELDSIKNIERKNKDSLSNPIIISYKLDSIKNAHHLDSIYNLYTEEEMRIILLINRIEQNRLKIGSRLIIPDTLISNLLTYSPMPEHLRDLDSIPKAILIAQRIQAFGLYEKGKLIRWGPVSTGKQATPTPNGLSYANFKSKRKISTVNPDWIMPYYFNFLNFQGVGVHQYLLPGYPASHACVRLDMEDAIFIYNWAVPWTLDSKGKYLIKNGTPFMVFGEYNFKEEVPWLGLAKDPAANNLNPLELETLKNYVEEYMEDERNFVKDEIPQSENVLGI